MPLHGGSSDESIEHDDVSSWQHERDKHAQSRRIGMDWLGIPKGGEFAFKNDFSAIAKDEALYYFLGGIPEVRAADLRPEDWDSSGSMASYSAGSEVAMCRDFVPKKSRGRRGPKTSENLPNPPSPPVLATELRSLDLRRLHPKDYKALLRLVRDETSSYHRWVPGADGRYYWKQTPVATSIKLVEGELHAGLLDFDEIVAGFEPEGPQEKTRKVKCSRELLRFTVNSHPALARAMSKLVADGRKEEIRDLMERAIPELVGEFERVTGRRVAGVSVHFDSDLPHWNLWHTGLERVVYQKGKGKERSRYRRTAMNLNSSGPGLRAWRRSQKAFERLGKQGCAPTIQELKKAERKALDAQGRGPGDWSINDVADSVLERLLEEAGHTKEIGEGFQEFVANEEKRYAAGQAGKVSKMEKEKLAGEIRKLHLLVREKDAEMETQREELVEAKQKSDASIEEAQENARRDVEEAREIVTRIASEKEATLRELEEARERLALITGAKDAEIEAARAEVGMIGTELERVKEVADKQLETSTARITELETRVEVAEDAAELAGCRLEEARKDLATVTSEMEAEIHAARAEADKVGRELQNVKVASSEQLKASTVRIAEMEKTLSAAEDAKESAMQSEGVAKRRVAEMEQQIQSSKITATIAAKAINLLQRIVASPLVMKVLGKNNDLRKELMDFGNQTGIKFADPLEKSVEKAHGPTMED